LRKQIKGELVKTGNLDEKRACLRWVGKLPFGFDYGMESALQRLASERTISTRPATWLLATR
jgi:hypothetical protein